SARRRRHRSCFELEGRLRRHRDAELYERFPVVLHVIARFLCEVAGALRLRGGSLSERSRGYDGARHHQFPARQFHFFCSEYLIVSASRAAASIAARGADSPVQISNCRIACSINILTPAMTCRFWARARRISSV